MNPEPVLLRENASDVLNPSVFEVNGQLFNHYSEYDGHTWRTALATSSDGIHWTKKFYVLAPNPETWEGAYIAANGSSTFSMLPSVMSFGKVCWP